MKFLGLSHIAIRVTNLAKARAFYVGILGFQPITESERLVLTHAHGLLLGILGNDPHTEAGDKFNPYRVGLDHLALGVPNRKALEMLKQALDSAGVRNNGIERDTVGNVDYISFYDPDGIAWEFYVMPLRTRLALGVVNLLGLKIPQQRASKA